MSLSWNISSKEKLYRETNGCSIVHSFTGNPCPGGHVGSEVNRAPLSADCFWSSEFRALPQIWIRLCVLIRSLGIYVFNKPYEGLIEEILITIAVTAEATRKVLTAMKSRFSKIVWCFFSEFYPCSFCIWKIALLILGNFLTWKVGADLFFWAIGCSITSDGLCSGTIFLCTAAGDIPRRVPHLRGPRVPLLPYCSCIKWSLRG